jgi:hypothetical protein
MSKRKSNDKSNSKSNSNGFLISKNQTSRFSARSRASLTRTLYVSLDNADKVIDDEITVSAPCERVDLEALKATKARRKGAER